MGKCEEKRNRGWFLQNTNINEGVWTSGEPFEKFRDLKMQFES